MKPQAKEIREHVARARAYANKLNIVKSLRSLSDGLELLLQSQVFGREKFELGILVDEVLRTLSAQDEFKRFVPQGLKYTKGQERQMFLVARKLADKIEEIYEKARMEEVRKSKNLIDGMILQGQSLLDKKDNVAARKMFYKVVEKFPDEIGLAVDCGQRLIMAGQFQDAIDFLEKGIKADPKDTRPYSHLVTCYESMGDLEKAEALIKDILRRHGANESIYTRLAKLYIKLRKWSEAYDAAEQALSFNEFSPDALKIKEKAASRVFSGGKAKAKGGGTVDFNVSKKGGKKKANGEKKAQAKPQENSKAIKFDF